MTHRYIKIAVTAFVLIAAFSGLLAFTLREGTEYYKHVDEVLPQRAQWEGKRLQLHGFVVPGSIMVNPNTLEYRFKVENNGHVVNASYKGIVPDTFKNDGAEVVLKGRLTASGFETEPNGIMAKCPSKYEEQKRAATDLKKVG